MNLILKMWLEQDGDTCYTTHATIEVFQKKFEEGSNSRYATVKYLFNDPTAISTGCGGVPLELRVKFKSF